jgi:hypothetical protein
MTVSVVGTVFLVNAADSSRVGVIEGQVRTRVIETRLRPGEQVPPVRHAARPLSEDIN